MKRLIGLVLIAILLISATTVILLISKPLSNTGVLQMDEDESYNDQAPPDTEKDESFDNTTEVELPDNTAEGELPEDTAEDDSPSPGHPNPVNRYTVTFHSHGGSELSSKSIAKGKPLGRLPVPVKTDSVFVGWFTDDETFEHEAYATTVVKSDLDLYACYFGSPPLTEADGRDTTNVSDVASDYTLTVLSSDPGMTADEVKSGIALETITEDASNFGGITVAGRNGRYTVAAAEGYTPGCSYSLILKSDKLTFKDESSAVRTYNLTVQMAEPVMNVELCDDVRLIPAGDISQVTQNGKPVDSIFAPLFSEGEADSNETLNGTFKYSGNLSLAVGDQLAIYEGTAPDKRSAEKDYSDEPVGYVMITGIASAGIYEYGAPNPDEILFMPDLIPVKISDDMDGDPDNHSLTIGTDKLTFTDPADFVDFDLGDYELNADTTIDSGDYIIFYPDGGRFGEL